MATVYEIKIKTVSPWCRYDKEHMKQMFEKFLSEYRAQITGMKFESTEVEVKILNP